MSKHASEPLTEWKAGLRVWLERAGEAVLGPGRLELLEGIARGHSISEAARQMGMSYRRAWLLVQSINQAAGQPVVEAVTGGNQGGGARLTAHGHQLVALFREFQERLRTTAAGTLPGLLARVDSTAAVHVVAAMCLEEVLGRLLADFARRQPAVPVRVIFGASDELADHLLGGGTADLFLSADERQLDRLAAAGIAEPSVCVPLASNHLVALGTVSLRVPVRKTSDLLRSGVQRIACAKPGSPLGNYTAAYFKRAGLHEELQSRLLTVDNSRMVVPALHAGQADLGVVYGSDAVAAAGCRLLFRIPRSAVAIQISAGLLRCGRQPERARLLLDFLTTSSAGRRFQECGFLRLPAARTARTGERGA
jgi:molybdate transport system regulatory protein